MSAALDAVRLAEGIIELRKDYEILLKENTQLRQLLHNLNRKTCDAIYSIPLRPSPGSTRNYWT
jgi:type III secretion system FlhB-like substrate exporter